MKRQAVDFCENAYILDIKPYRDTTVILALITENNGLVDVICHGATSIKLGLAATLQLFNEIQICYSQKPNVELRTLVTVSLLTPFNMEKAQWIGYCIANLWSEMVRKLFPMNDVVSELYSKTDCLMKCVGTIGHYEDANRLYLSLTHLFYDLIATAGYALSFSKCSFCGKQLPKETKFVDLNSGQCVCDECVKNCYHESLFPLSTGYFEWLKDHIKKGHQYDGKRYFSDSIHLIDAYLQNHLSIQCKTIALLSIAIT